MRNKKYQIFVSSTYLDLKKERNEVMYSILSIGHIPIGMELFPAGNDEVWEKIKSTIEESDYYIVIAGKRYGSMAVEGISYTEKEYDYALSRGIPVSAFIIDENKKVHEKKLEKDEDKKEKLERFKKKLMEKSCAFWKSSKDLALGVVTSLSDGFGRNPRPGGWVKVEENNIVTKKIIPDVEATREIDDPRSNKSIIKTSDITPPSDYETVLIEEFNNLKNWEIFKNGKIEISNDYDLEGKTCMKKSSYGDPHGGFKKLNCKINNGFRFSGLIYSPEQRSNATADRLSVENSKFNGYGFGVNLTTKKMWIERRVKGMVKKESNQSNLTVPLEHYYYFTFILGENLTATLLIKNLSDVLLGEMKYQFEAEIRNFDRIAVHGGYDYYINSIVVERLIIFDILKATYGVYGVNGKTIDITDRLKEMIDNKSLIFSGKYNNIAGDPAPNEKKEIIIVYTTGNLVKKARFRENQEIILP